MKELFDMISRKSSKMTTVLYSTSFSIGIRFFNRRFHDPIYGVYGFVRFADEIVDSFEGYDKQKLLTKFREDTYSAIHDKISLNPILNNFQFVVNKYGISNDLIDAFLDSMEMDLRQMSYNRTLYDTYIVGSAEVVGLMCLKVFCEGNSDTYNHLEPAARKLGAAFQKVNFLRDLKADSQQLNRFYFPGLSLSEWNEQAKLDVIKEVKRDFAEAVTGIRQLPAGSRFGVYVAYVYFKRLLTKIENTQASALLLKRVRISNPVKYMLLCQAYLKNVLNLI
jgi:phytoene/squalene synthetase